MITSVTWKLSIILMVGIAIAGAAVDVLAQQLEEVVVTAERRSESIQEIPIAITVMSGLDLQEMRFESLNEIGAQVPNMQVSSPYGTVQPIFSIRGVSMADYNSNQDSPIGVYVDEAYLGAVYTHGLNFFDLERIEVLRGPQGTLYGKNTTGGAINVITRTPEIDGPVSGNVKLGFANYEAIEAFGAVEGTLVEGVLAARFAFNYAKDDGYYKNALGGDNLAQTEISGARITLNWQPTNAFNAVFKYTISDSDPRSHPPRNEGRIPVPGLGLVDINGYQRPTSLKFQEGQFNKVGHTDLDLDQATLRLTYDLDNYSIVSVSSWYDANYVQGVDTDGSPFSLLEVDWGSQTNAFSQDLRFVSEFASRFNFIAGLYYGTEDLETQNVVTLYEDPTILIGTPLGDLLTEFGIVDQRLRTKKQSLAAYTQLSFELTERLSMDVGLRYTVDENKLTYINISRLDYQDNPLGSWVPGNITGNLVDNPFLPPEFDPAGNGFYLDGPYTLNSAPTLDEKNGEWTGKLSFEYTFSATMNGYASYSHGYRSGNFNGGLYYVPRPFEGSYAAPEFLDAYEIGLKAEFFDNRVRANTAAFYYDYTDQQFVNIVGVSTFLENAGGSNIYGLELELSAQATEKLVLGATLGWLNSEYSELYLTNTLTPDPADLIDLSGNELISAPKLNFSFAADYQVPLASGYDLRAHFDASYRDDQWFSAYNGEIGYDKIKQDSYWLLNGQLSIHFGAGQNYTVTAWIKNITNENYDVYAINLQAGFGYDFYQSGPPRTYGLEFSYLF